MKVEPPKLIKRAEVSGFCGGVKRAVNLAYRLISEWPERKKKPEGSAALVMLGSLIHNKIVVNDLISKGMRLCESVSEIPENSTVLIRAHGISREELEALRDKSCVVEDACCAYVKKIQNLVSKAAAEGKNVFVAGNPNHPEVRGIVSASGNTAIVIEDISDVEKAECRDGKWILVSQTTFSIDNFNKISEKMNKKIERGKIFATICGATEARQNAAKKLAAESDVMVIIGSRESSNTRKLYELCSEVCGENYLVETPGQVSQLIAEGRLSDKIVGVTAGASSPESIIVEVMRRMGDQQLGTEKLMQETEGLKTEEMIEGAVENTADAAVKPQDAETAGAGETAAADTPSADMPNEAESGGDAAEVAKEESDSTEEAEDASENKPESDPAETEVAGHEEKKADGDISFTDAIDNIPQLKRGAIVNGILVRRDDDFVYVDVHDKTEGKIPIREFDKLLDFNLDEAISKHEKMEVYVRSIKNTEFGKEILLSKARVDFAKNKALVEQAFKDKTPIKVRVTNIVKDGVIASLGGVDIYIHRTQLELYVVQDLEEYKDKDLEILVTQFDPDKRRLRVAGSRRSLLNRDRKKKAEELWDNIAIGDVYEGVVRSLTNFGAFVDIGGVDGLVHISELSWNRIKHPSEAVSVGDVVQVYIKDFDREARRIKLGYKRIEDDPYHDIEDRFPLGSVVHGKVMRLLNYGAFVEIAEGVDAFCHISQISSMRLNKPDEVLKVGMEVDARVIDVRNAERRIGISIKEVAPIDTKIDGTEFSPKTGSQAGGKNKKNKSGEEAGESSYSDDGAPKTSTAFGAKLAAAAGNLEFGNAAEDTNKDEE